MLIKVCGMRDPDNIAQIEATGADMMGFIFFDKSSRFVGNVKPVKTVSCKRVGVFVDSEIDYILEIASEWELDFVQLHGHESPQMCDTIREYGYRVIKVISISDLSSLKLTERYQGRADMLLFDTKCTGYGGSGRCFDWNILHAYQGKLPFLLSGGLGPQNITEIGAFCHPRMVGVDLNSKFELSPGIKDVASVTNFIKQIRQWTLTE